MSGSSSVFIDSLGKISSVDFLSVKKEIENSLKNSSYALEDKDSFCVLAASYIVLRNVLDGVISGISGDIEGAFSLSRQHVVEIETRIQFLKAHLLRVISVVDSTATDSTLVSSSLQHDLLASGFKSCQEFFPDISRAFLELSLVSRSEGGASFFNVIDTAQKSFQKMSIEFEELFKNDSASDRLKSKMNL